MMLLPRSFIRHNRFIKSIHCVEGFSNHSQIDTVVSSAEMNGKFYYLNSYSIKTTEYLIHLFTKVYKNDKNLVQNNLAT